MAKSTNKKLLELGWIVLLHPLYSSDLVLTDYHLFRSLADHFTDKIFNDVDDLKNELDHFFCHKSREFYANGIFNLPERWHQVVDTDRVYIHETMLKYFKLNKK